MNHNQIINAVNTQPTIKLPTINTLQLLILTNLYNINIPLLNATNFTTKFTKLFIPSKGNSTIAQIHQYHINNQQWVFLPEDHNARQAAKV